VRKDVPEAMQKAGFEKEAIERGKEIQEQVFREQRRAARAEQERLDRLTGEYRLQGQERYREL
jgi:hypothetical protein